MPTCAMPSSSSREAPLLEFGACRAAEGEVVEADAELVEGRSAAGPMGVDAEELDAKTEWW